MPEDTEQAIRPVRLRPEEIVAQTFSSPLPAGTNDGWSPRARRLFLAAMALAGALLVTAGLLVTGELGPDRGPSAPLETGGDANSVAGSLLPPLADGQTPTSAADATAPTPTTANGPTRRTVPPVVAPNQRGQNSSTPSPDPGAPNLTKDTQTTDDSTPTSTTLPCDLLGSRSLGAQIPPLCR